MAGKLSVNLENRLDEIQRVDTAVEEFAEQVGLPFDVCFQIRLSIEELFTNIVNYGYEDSDVHEVQITVEALDKRVEIGIIDDAKEFNPLTRAEKEQPDSLEDMDIGGQGIVLIKAYMDEIDYEYADGKNKLKLVKYLE